MGRVWRRRKRRRPIAVKDVSAKIIERCRSFGCFGAGMVLRAGGCFNCCSRSSMGYAEDGFG